MSSDRALASLYEAATGTSPPPDVRERLVAEYDEALALSEVSDPDSVTASLGALIAALRTEEESTGPLDGVHINALTEFFPALPRLMPCEYVDHGEWARLTVPSIGWALRLWREGDAYVVEPIETRAT